MPLSTTPDIPPEMDRFFTTARLLPISNSLSSSCSLPWTALPFLFLFFLFCTPNGPLSRVQYAVLMQYAARLHSVVTALELYGSCWYIDMQVIFPSHKTALSNLVVHHTMQSSRKCTHEPHTGSLRDRNWSRQAPDMQHSFSRGTTAWPRQRTTDACIILQHVEPPKIAEKRLTPPPPATASPVEARTTLFRTASLLPS